MQVVSKIVSGRRDISCQQSSILEGGWALCMQVVSKLESGMSYYFTLLYHTVFHFHVTHSGMSVTSLQVTRHCNFYEKISNQLADDVILEEQTAIFTSAPYLSYRQLQKLYPQQPISCIYAAIVLYIISVMIIGPTKPTSKTNFPTCSTPTSLYVEYEICGLKMIQLFDAGGNLHRLTSKTCPCAETRHEY